MALRTTSGPGSLLDPTKWSGGVAPVSGDTLSIGHAMTWTPAANTSWTIGTGTGVACTFGTAGSLTINPVGAFDLVFAGSTAGGNITTYELVVNATAGNVTITVDATANATGFAMLTGANYDALNRGGWNLVAADPYRITFVSLPSDGTKNSYPSSGGQYGGGVVNGQRMTWRRIGTATQAAYAPALDNRNRSLSWSDVLLDGCGEVALGGDANHTATVSFADVKSSNTLTNGTSKYPINLSFAAAGTRTFARCSWDKTIKLVVPKGIALSVNYLHNGWVGSAGTSTGAPWDSCFIRQTFDSLITSWDITNSFRYWDNPSGSNPHWDSLNGSATGTVVYTHSGNIYYYNGNDAAGNIINCASSSTTMSVVANNNLVLPNAAGTSSGTLMTCNGAVGNGFAITANHNTIHCKGCHGFEIGHLYSGPDTTNRYVSVKSNLFIGGGTGYKAIDVDPVLIVDIMPPAVVDYNGSYQIKATAGNPSFTNEGKGYAGVWSATPGAHDVDGVNPAFANGSASLSGWDLSLGGPGTDAAAAARIQANPALITDLMAYFAAAYRPTAQQFKGTAHDGGDMGAFPVLVVAAAGPIVHFTGGIGGLGIATTVHF